MYFFISVDTFSAMRRPHGLCREMAMRVGWGHGQLKCKGSEINSIMRYRGLATTWFERRKWRGSWP